MKWLRRWTSIAFWVGVIIAVSLPPAEAQTSIDLPDGFEARLIAQGLTSPTAMQFAPDGRLFVTEQRGAVRVIEDDVLLATPFVTLSTDFNGERGLLGIAFAPNFPVNPFVYLYYTTSTAPIHNRVSRFLASGNQAVSGSETIIVDLDNLSGATNHNGGTIHFGPDGKLYIAIGENAHPPSAQSFNTRHGKILRLNADGSIPTDNPFYDDPQVSGANRAIWALGLRNPFNFSFQPGTGRMFINDVGQNSWEEINDGIAGANYGWPATEGYTSDPDFTSPLYAYAHGGECAITGSAFYNPSNPTVIQFPADYTGDYFFADYCESWIKRYDIAGDTVEPFATNAANDVV
ncbi:MAG: PQQ-dependent sugar dehydrogenase, partial [Anaerolineae bacterium]|nr:PQQ-dependent sugar dehydrogenase [Anaerolineae bacterium]